MCVFVSRSSVSATELQSVFLHLCHLFSAACCASLLTLSIVVLLSLCLSFFLCLLLSALVFTCSCLYVYSLFICVHIVYMCTHCLYVYSLHIVYMCTHCLYVYTYCLCVYKLSICVPFVYTCLPLSFALLNIHYHYPSHLCFFQFLNDPPIPLRLFREPVLTQSMLHLPGHQLSIFVLLPITCRTTPSRILPCILEKSKTTTRLADFPATQSVQHFLFVF